MINALNFKSPNAWGRAFDTFKGLYIMKDYLTIPKKSNKKEVRRIKNKVCRFCNRTENGTTFKSLSHKIPKLMGNRFWYSEDECDNCNFLFHQYETHLSDFFGLDRSLQKVKGGSKYPKFKSPRETLEVRVGEFYNLSGVYIQQNSNENDHFQYNKETGELKITTKTTPFIPVYVYKALLKIALSILPKEEVTNYHDLLPFILDPASNYISSCPIAGYMLHDDARFDFQSLIFEKKDSKLKLPNHFFCFYWLSNIIIIYLPNHKNDIWMKDQYIEVPVPPPLFLNIDDDLLEKLPIKYFMEDFHSFEPIKDRLREVVFRISPETMKELIGKNMDTGEIFELGEFDISKIKGLFISKDDETPTVYFDETDHVE
jgi:hypothetical protein